MWLLRTEHIKISTTRNFHFDFPLFLCPLTMKIYSNRKPAWSGRMKCYLGEIVSLPGPSRQEIFCSFPSKRNYLLFAGILNEVIFHCGRRKKAANTRKEKKKSRKNCFLSDKNFLIQWIDFSFRSTSHPSINIPTNLVGVRNGPRKRKKSCVREIIFQLKFNLEREAREKCEKCGRAGYF